LYYIVRGCERKGGVKMNIFQMKTQPHGNESLNLFLNENFVCIGYPGIGDLTGVDKDEIRDRLQDAYKWSGSQLGNHLGIVNAFVNTMRSGDIVLVSENEWVHIGRLGDYNYNYIFENEGKCHRRDVTWIGKVKRDCLNEHVRELLRNRSIITKFKHPSDIAELDKLILNTSSIINVNLNIDEKILTKAIDVLNRALESEDEEIRVKSALGLLQYLK
jgi:predicted Mrr-cat superfamily restriction endonuclease